MRLDFRKLDLSALSPARRAPRSGDHFVEFYEDDDSLVGLIQIFLSVALRENEVALVIATPAHRRKIEEVLTSSGIDVAGARDEGRYVSLDAEELLSDFTTDGELDEERCVEVVGGLLSQAARHGNNVRVFGEMVAVLWSQGHVVAAIALERLWNRLADAHRFRLFCAYPAEEFAREDLAVLREVCRHHSHVITPA